MPIAIPLESELTFTLTTFHSCIATEHAKATPNFALMIRALNNYGRLLIDTIRLEFHRPKPPPPPPEPPPEQDKLPEGCSWPPREGENWHEGKNQKTLGGITWVRWEDFQKGNYVPGVVNFPEVRPPPPTDHLPYIYRYRGPGSDEMNEWELQNWACLQLKLEPPPYPDEPGWQFGWRPEGWVDPPAEELEKVTIPA